MPKNVLTASLVAILLMPVASLAEHRFTLLCTVTQLTDKGRIPQQDFVLTFYVRTPEEMAADGTGGYGKYFNWVYGGQWAYLVSYNSSEYVLWRYGDANEGTEGKIDRLSGEKFSLAWTAKLAPYRLEEGFCKEIPLQIPPEPKF